MFTVRRTTWFVTLCTSASSFLRAKSSTRTESAPRYAKHHAQTLVLGRIDLQWKGLKEFIGWAFGRKIKKGNCDPSCTQKSIRWWNNGCTAWHQVQMKCNYENVIHVLHSLWKKRATVLKNEVICRRIWEGPRLAQQQNTPEKAQAKWTRHGWENSRHSVSRLPSTWY